MASTIPERLGHQWPGLHELSEALGLSRTQRRELGAPAVAANVAVKERETTPMVTQLQGRLLGLVQEGYLFSTMDEIAAGHQVEDGRMLADYLHYRHSYFDKGNGGTRANEIMAPARFNVSAESLQAPVPVVMWGDNILIGVRSQWEFVERYAAEGQEYDVFRHSPAVDEEGNLIPYTESVSPMGIPNLTLFYPHQIDFNEKAFNHTRTGVNRLAHVANLVKRQRYLHEAHSHRYYKDKTEEFIKALAA